MGLLPRSAAPPAFAFETDGSKVPAVRSLAIAVGLLASLAMAQPSDLSDAAAPPREVLSAPPPPVLPPDPSEAAPNPLLDPAFADNLLAWNPKTRTASVGLRHTPLARDAFYALLGQPELSVSSARALKRRVWLFVGAGAALAAGAVTAVAMWTSLPSLNGGYCTVDIANYNGPLCIEQYKAKMAIGAGALVAGVVGAALLSTFAMWSSPDVLQGDAAQAAVSRYNAGLRQRVARSDGVSLHLSPLLWPSGGGLLASGRF